MKTIINVAIFASGSGSNAENITKYYSNVEDVNVKLILSNNNAAYVLERAKKMNIDSYVFTKKEFNSEKSIIKVLQDNNIDFIVLAGFLLLVPKILVQSYSDRIINIHPALLPKYGGKGMYGDRVHQAVKSAKEKETGITIHLVNEQYDEGAVLFQDTVPVVPTDTVSDIAAKVHALEYAHFPKVIDNYIRKIQ